MKDQNNISDAEWQVMNVVWVNQPVTAGRIIQILESKQKWSPATVRTFLHRLTKKGVLEFETEGNRYVYRAAANKTSQIRQASKSFLKTVFDGQTSPLLTYFVKSHRFSNQEIAELRKLLDEKEATR